MSVSKVKNKPKFWKIDGAIYIDGKKYRYHRQDLNDSRFTSKKFCEELEKNMRQEIIDKNSAKGDFQRLSMKGLVDAYLEKIKTDGYRESTIQSLLYKIDLYIYKFYGRGVLVYNAFTIEKSIEFRNFVGTFNMTANYKNRILTLLKQLINYATTVKAISYNTERDCENVLTPIRNNDQKKEIHFYTTLEEAKRVRQNASSDFYKNVFMFFYFSGCRISEFLGITRKDVTFTKDDKNNLIAEIDINKQVSKTKGEILPYLKTGSSYRKIVYYGAVAEELYKYIEKYKFDENDLIFNISKTTLRRELDLAFDKAGVRRNTFHGFGRKSIATYLYAFTNNVKLPQMLLGHKEVDMTLNTYVLNEALKENLEKALKEIEKK